MSRIISYAQKSISYHGIHMGLWSSMKQPCCRHEALSIFDFYHFAANKCKTTFDLVNGRLTIFSILNARQCGAYMYTRGRCLKQLTNLYAKIYTEQASRKYKVVKHAVKILSRVKEFKKTSKLPAVLLSTAIVHCQSFTKDIITDLEIERVRDDSLALLNEIRSNPSCKLGNGSKGNGLKSDLSEEADASLASASDAHGSNGKRWEIVLDKEHIKIWRKKPDFPTPLYEYRVFGTYSDLPASAFWYVQLDLDYRRQWDKYVISLKIIDREPTTGTELVQWITHFPYPMEDREYMFIRKHVVDLANKTMILISRSVANDCNGNVMSNNHDIADKQDMVNNRQNWVNSNQNVKTNGETVKNSQLSNETNSAIINNQVATQGKCESCVRIDKYQSTMVIRPHREFDENGFDYILIYYDDPKTKIPASAYNKMAKTGVIMFIKDVHQAARKLFSDARASDTPPTALNGSAAQYYTSRTW